MRDVGAAAGVSYQTVSRVLNNSLHVDPVTRQTVMQVIDELAYRPNRAARTLGLGRATDVTVLTADTTLYGYAGTLQGVEEAARRRNLAVAIRVIESAAEADVRQAVEYALDPSAGRIVVIAFDAAGARVLRALPEFVSAIGATESGGLEGTSHPTMHLAEQAVAAEATRHLLSLGHRTVHHVAIPTEGTKTARQRGWRDALREAGATIPRVVRVGWDVESAYRVGCRLAADPEVTAIFCGNDGIALGVRRALFEAGRRVPEHVSLIGFDDVPGAAYWTPALTTVAMDFVGLGRACVARLAGEPDDVDRPRPPRLIFRESTAPPPRA